MWRIFLSEWKAQSEKLSRACMPRFWFAAQSTIALATSWGGQSMSVRIESAAISGASSSER